MNRLKNLIGLVLIALAFAACDDEETSLGTSLTDPTTRYQGITATWTADAGMSYRDDSVTTSWASPMLIGHYTDAVYGRVATEWYTQVAIPSSVNNINFDSVDIDSVVLSLVKTRLFPDSTATYSLHFEVRQLAEALKSDSLYRASNTIAVADDGLLCDTTFSVGATDTVLRLKLKGRIADILSQNGSADEFAEAVRGLRIKLLDDSSPALLGINLNATETALKVHYSHPTIGSSTYNLVVGSTAAHFLHADHDYSGTPLAGKDSVEGSDKLYLEPLAGFSFRLSFDSTVRAFAAAHPLAVIHHAELLLPVGGEASDQRPARIIATHRNAAGNEVYIADALDAVSYTGFDGTYDEARSCYRLRVTEHVQQMLRHGTDEGTTLMLNSRTSIAERTVINGIKAAEPVKINIVYSE